jgi:SAM-dependent methyltransferase
MFDSYAQFYDAYYKQKDYAGEVEFVLSCVHKAGQKSVASVLDIGCGTGGHVIPFALKGIRTLGIDRSEAMIRIAWKKLDHEHIQNADVVVANATTFRDGRTYDAAVAMFAVMGFITSNEDFLAALRTARVHLNAGGHFVFDCWFGPAVTHIMPSVRSSEFLCDGNRCIRIVEPIDVDPVREIVRTKNTVFCIPKDKVASYIVEYHEIRFFFIEELKCFFNKAGFELVFVCPFLDSSRPPTIEDWNITVVAKAI